MTKAKKLLSLLLTVAIAVTLFPVFDGVTAYAAAPVLSLPGADANGVYTITTSGQYDISAVGSGLPSAFNLGININCDKVILTGSPSSHLTVTVTGNYTLILKSVSFTSNSGNAIQMSGSGKIMLVGSNSLITTAPGMAAIYVPASASLTIQCPGSLSAKGGTGGGATGNGTSGYSGGTGTV